MQGRTSVIQSFPKNPYIEPILFFGPEDKGGGSREVVIISGLVLVPILPITLPMILSSTRIELLDSSVKVTTVKVFSTTIYHHEIDPVEVTPVTGTGCGAVLGLMGTGAMEYATGDGLRLPYVVP